MKPPPLILRNHHNRIANSPASNLINPHHQIFETLTIEWRILLRLNYETPATVFPKPPPSNFGNIHHQISEIPTVDFPKPPTSNFRNIHHQIYSNTPSIEFLPNFIGTRSQTTRRWNLTYTLATTYVVQKFVMFWIKGLAPYIGKQSNPSTTPKSNKVMNPHNAKTLIFIYVLPTSKQT